MTSEFEAARRAGRWGFRFFRTDAAVLVALAGLSLWWRDQPPLVWLPVVVGGHFFVFCNVVRLHRRLELLWSALFVGNLAAWAAFSEPELVPVLAIQLPVTFILVIREARLPRYHGIWADRLNPKLGEYLRAARR